MATRIEIQRKILRKQRAIKSLKGIGAVVFFLVLLYSFYVSTTFTIARIEIVNENYECKEYSCSYTIQLENKSSLNGMVNLNIYGTAIMASGPYGGKVVQEFPLDKITLKISGNGESVVTGEVAIKDKNMYLTFRLASFE